MENIDVICEFYCNFSGIGLEVCSSTLVGWKKQLIKDLMKNERKIKEALKRVTEYGWGHVDLRNCGLTEIPKVLYNYPEIVRIDLGNSHYSEQSTLNRITTLPSEIKLIKKLRYLNLENNKLEVIDPEISELTNLDTLNLSHNNLKEIPEQLANMPSLSELQLNDNPFDMLPPEIISRGIESIRNFFKELKEQDFIYEAKLIIVGEGRVGKTCISEALMDENYTLVDEESTEGIKLKRWVIKKEDIQKINPKIARDLQINIWDFGGQEIYHSTHQFFLTKRSIYLLVTESRKEDNHDDFFYWLNIIKLLGDKSPVVMVLNKCDQPTKELPIKEYKSKFSNISSFNKISLKEEFKDQFKEFKNTLAGITSNLPHIGKPLPKVWVDIRKELESLKLQGLNYISKAEYLDICKKYYRKEDSALFLSDFFHDIGVIIHFHADIDLSDIVILNHEWITKGVYKVLDDKQVIAQRGRFTNEDLKRIWSDDEHKQKVREMISLMKNNKFDLCFPLGAGEYLIPRLLPVDEIDHDWKVDESTSYFEYRYTFMPKGILARLIVKLNSDIFKNQYWRYGVILSHDGTTALIKEKYLESKISIELNGKDKREYLYVIRKAINEIHSDFNNLIYTEMVPCKCSLCLGSSKPHYFEHIVLRRYEDKEIQKIRCDISLEEIEVFNLTSDVVRKNFNEDLIIICENQNEKLLNALNLKKRKFFPAKDSSSVFIKVKTDHELYGLRDRDFLTDSEIDRITKKYPKYYILDYYCIENYLYHPDNLNELNLDGYNIGNYILEILRQKSEKRDNIIANFKNARNTYQEFKIEEEKLRDKINENEIMEYLKSDDIEIVLKSFSMKDHFNKDCLSKYQLKEGQLATTQWFKNKMNEVLKVKG